MTARLALEKALTLDGVSSVLDVGSGQGLHASVFREVGKSVTTCDFKDADVIGNYLHLNMGKFDLLWASHVLEHQVDPGRFLRKCYDDLNDNGWLCVTVPPAKDEIVGGHVTIWNEGLLLYNLILAGFDCSEAMVGRYGYNISVIVRKKRFDMPDLVFDYGDIGTLKDYFPLDVEHGFNGNLGCINWEN